MYKTIQILIGVFLLCFCSLSSMTGQSYDIANRWNIKAGYSRNVLNVLFIPISENPITLKEYKRKRSSNFRIEGNFAPIRFLEVGVYTGFMVYTTDRVIGFTEYEFMNYQGLFETIAEKAMILNFGINANLHLLPFFVKKENCRWDLYVCAKYGGTVLTKTKFPYLPLSIGYSSTAPYIQEYGIGIGGSVYFWNVFGLYTECSFGQYSLNPTMYKAWFNLRGGISFKWQSKKKTKLDRQNILIP